MSAINWAAIDWVSLVALSLLVLIVARIGERLSFGSRGLAAFITALLFAAGSLRFFSNTEMLVALGFGALLGLIGSRAAVARHAEA